MCCSGYRVRWAATDGSRLLRGGELAGDLERLVSRRDEPVLRSLQATAIAAVGIVVNCRAASALSYLRKWRL